MCFVWVSVCVRVRVCARFSVTMCAYVCAYVCVCARALVLLCVRMCVHMFACECVSVCNVCENDVSS